VFDTGISTLASMLPVTTMQCYVTGEPALSVPADGILSDWRLSTAFQSAKKPIPIAGSTWPSTQHLWGSLGISDQSPYLIGAGIASNGPIFVASPARAIADMVWYALFNGGDPACIQVDQIPLSADMRGQLVQFMRVWLERAPSAALVQWIEGQPGLVHLVAQHA
jgi:hypothetical protein